MSQLTKALIMLVAWFIFAFVTLKTCIEPTCCADDTRTEEATATEITPAAPVSTDYRLVSKLGDSTVLSGDLWPDYRAQLISEYQANPDQELEIYGHYYEGEAAPAGFENMGFYRADLIKQMLVPDIPADKIRTLARRIDGTRPEADALWDAGTFNWHAMAKTDEAPKTEIIQLASDEIVIRFPFDSDQKDPDATVDEYLQKLAQRLQQTDENVNITGHTDSVDTEAYNQRLGQRRADFIKNILVRYGADASRITTRSEGETNPVDTNKTAAGRHNNRRAVVKLISQ